MKATVDQSPYAWTRWYSGTILIDDVEYGFAVVTQESEQTAEEITNVEWEGQQPPIEKRGLADTEIRETWTEQHYAHYKRQKA